MLSGLGAVAKKVVSGHSPIHGGWSWGRVGRSVIVVTTAA
jgi:hypothetical protein